MNGTTPDQDRLLDEAIDLLIRQQNDPENPVAAEMIRAWRFYLAYSEAGFRTGYLDVAQLRLERPRVDSGS